MDLPLSLFGRAYLLKMVSFARLLYPLHTLPLLLKHKDLIVLHKAMQLFLWQKKRLRIWMGKLFLPKEEEGLGLPKLKVYNLACLMRYTIDWVLVTSVYVNRELEESINPSRSLIAMFHSHFCRLPQDIRNHTLFRDTIIAWRAIQRKQ